jgi:hypothetical protein
MTTASPILILRGLGATESGGGDVRKEHDLLVGQLVRNLRQVRLGIWHE